jgi:vancomycin resistance protein YoaR
MATEYVEAKVHNVTLALKSVNDLLIPPGAIFSFWHVVGSANQRSRVPAGTFPACR